MKEPEFIDEHSAMWERFEEDLKVLEKRSVVGDAVMTSRTFSQVCHHLALARHRMYGAELCERLNALVSRGSRFFSKPRRSSAAEVWYFLTAGFPATVRKEWRLFWISTLVFLIPFVWAALAVGNDSEWAHAILGADGMESVEKMYGKGADLETFRGEFDSNFMMWAFYVWNNVRIDFQMVAGGLLAGVGTLFFLLFNGVFLGAFTGWVHQSGDPQKFYSFVVGHSSLEMVGMLIAGMAGLRIGCGILFPGRLRRGVALADAAKRALPMIYGSGLMTFFAAFIEGFWSAQDVPVSAKYWAGGAGWLLLVAYFLLAGRGKEALPR
ncbi:stage II sporulation protein M [Sulfuriroseicoccus oceanibius]|uniref:Stage II sporulation protein M n=1 Tax=Sulfuriroseicoccus oceanibius TaxID=2707525 RepID=A0A6B3LDN0_9BACT|nr:stage II sporulation protein M [Sulfuriroseicoccus oceanibius]QQL45693.1 stage II sporulation protein M [Sulfuriroseicoccus oceanibius]